MPLYSRIGVRLALLNLVVGFGLGAAMMLAKAGVLSPVWMRWLAIHHWMLIFGWMTQFAISIAFWILPRLPRRTRGRERFFLAALVLLNVGELLGIGGVETAGRGATILALMAFGFHALPRIARLSPTEAQALREG